MRSKFYTLMSQAALATLAVFGANKAAAQYCAPSTNYGCSYDYISAFSTSGGVTNISNTSACTGSTYYAGYVHTTSPGATVNFSYTNGADAEYYKIWVDFNGDQDFLDVGEEVYSTGSTKISGSSPVTGSFVVPSGATPGYTRLRIRNSYSSSAVTSCSTEDYGEFEDYDFVIQSPCTAMSNITYSNVTSKTATVSWIGVSGVLGYQYALNTTSAYPTATPTNTTATTFNATGLTPSTWYWVFVRTQCSANSISLWVKDSFKTLPPCQPPVGFKTTDLKPTSTTINWNAWPSALTYDYIVDQDRANPGGATSVTNTAQTNGNITGLTEDTKYYVHIRSNCAFGENSDWSLDSFTTPIPCRAPVIKIDHINTTQAVAYWDAVPSAVSYEYVLTKSSMPPAVGTRYMYTSIHTSALNDGDDYYIHARCSCSSQQIESVSPWGTANFKTFPTGVTNVNSSDAMLEVYPNPVKDKLMVTIGNRAGAATLAVIDMSGKIVQSSVVSADKVEINTTGLPAGIYMLKYKDDSRTEVIKITKQ